MTRTVGFENAVQAALYNHEMTGQMSDGQWENSGPHDHWRESSSAEGVVDKAKLGPQGFHPRKLYNFANGQLHDAVGDRMLIIGKLATKYPELAKSDKPMHDLEYTITHFIKGADAKLAPDALSIAEKLSTAKDDYFKKLYDKAANFLGAKTPEEMVKKVKEVLDADFEPRDVKIQLKRMTKIFAGKSVNESLIQELLALREEKLTEGACEQFHSFDGKLSVEDLKRKLSALRDNLRSEYGHDRYGGHLACKPAGLNIIAGEEPDSEKAREILGEKSDKSDPCAAIKTKSHSGKDIWLVGGWCPE